MPHAAAMTRHVSQREVAHVLELTSAGLSAAASTPRAAALRDRALSLVQGS